LTTSWTSWTSCLVLQSFNDDYFCL